ncbi:hypothetical protein GQ457_07G011810 [Hibiscus cannabinus]
MGGDDRRIFTVKSAYNLCNGDAQGVESPLWKAVLKYRGLPRIRLFLWLVFQGKILTNSEQVRRHMSNDPGCGLCGASVEDLSHLFWDCFEARMLWSRVVKEEKLSVFLTIDFQTWLVSNFQNQQDFAKNPEDWDIAFGTYLWNIWRRRNERLFSPDIIPAEDIYFRSSRMIAEFGRASSMLRLHQHAAPNLTAAVQRWEAPATGWIKINTDGSRNTSTGLASCGGVGCDSNSRWCFGFAKGLGSCSCLEAEFWGIYEGLATAWSLQYTRVIIETDNREAYEAIASSNSRKFGSSILPSIFELLSRSWEVRVSFVRREGNVVADAISRLVLPTSLEYRRWLEVPLAIRELVMADGIPWGALITCFSFLLVIFRID